MSSSEHLHHLLRRCSATGDGLRFLPSGIAALDALLPGGGIPRGRLSEISGDRSSGKRALALAFCIQTSKRDQAVWIDGSGGFYPLPALEHGAALQQLIVVRPPPPSPATMRGRRGARSNARRRARDIPSTYRRRRRTGIAKAIDILLQAPGAAALIVVDLPLLAERHVTDYLARIQRTAERSGSAVLFVTEKPEHCTSLGTFVGLHLRVQRCSPPAVPASLENPPSSPQDRRQAVRVWVAKSKLGKMAEQTEVALDATHSVRLDTTV